MITTVCEFNLLQLNSFIIHFTKYAFTFYALCLWSLHKLNWTAWYALNTQNKKYKGIHETHTPPEPPNYSLFLLLFLSTTNFFYLYHKKKKWNRNFLAICTNMYTHCIPNTKFFEAFRLQVFHFYIQYMTKIQVPKGRNS